MTDIATVTAVLCVFVICGACLSDVFRKYQIFYLPGLSTKIHRIVHITYRYTAAMYIWVSWAGCRVLGSRARGAAAGGCFQF
jgi:hypothetical protein